MRLSTFDTFKNLHGLAGSENAGSVAIDDIIDGGVVVRGTGITLQLD